MRGELKAMSFARLLELFASRRRFAQIAHDRQDLGEHDDGALVRALRCKVEESHVFVRFEERGDVVAEPALVTEPMVEARRGSVVEHAQQELDRRLVAIVFAGSAEAEAKRRLARALAHEREPRPGERGAAARRAARAFREPKRALPRCARRRADRSGPRR